MRVSIALIRPLVVRTVAVTDPRDLLAHLPGTAPYAWIRRGEGLVGWGVAARAEVPPGPGRFDWAREWLASLFEGARIDDQVGLPGSGPVAFGSFTFDRDVPGSVLVVPRVVLARRQGQAWLTTIGEAETLPVAPATEPGRIRYGDGTLSAPEWQHVVAQAVAKIKAGVLDKVVLARDLRATAEREIDPRALLARLADRYPECYTFSVDGLVGATPELLVRHIGRSIESLVLAGTVSRGTGPAEDAARAAELYASAKDREEHGYAVASVRQALAPLCAELHVPDEPDLLVLPNVQHLATRITGRLSDGASVLDVVAAMHPTAAVGGTPTDAAIEVIRELEGMDRGRYAGPVGWIDSRGDGEWGIALRCAEVSGREARLFAGCGIMGGSDPAAELAEAQAKFRVMQYALEG
ncbi:isochorismate synthase [Thermobispora bispora]|uniref:isochorismate synthase n=1 Tax=Thermobispora bispora (strain ATCC 19993 / DSM 43833 / CBS 139.67 / JCM 10125 / KCTC 9307 / NBRC 14880 / R51) TaxID=469371 RepID=D6YB70_THEBD|nr:isochorismate synthase [Thermobispora bispora]ADG88430.1 isochorismate synthase [Thermobispora bispora DSM 43833]MBO2475248.1 isochorismate synthase [Actinomycetales bacterium]MDI9579320.1 isochorismate synthase [Thermobispora sp.]QSI48245.1 isochorismate synthase [Thermobispora bispora]